MNKSRNTKRFLDMLIVLLEGKTTLADSLLILTSENIPQMIQDDARFLLDSLRNGYSLSDSLRKIKEKKSASLNFSEVHLSLIASAEETGALIPILRDICDDYDRRLKSRELLVSAFMYPSLVILVAICGTCFLLLYGIPLFVHNGMISENTVSSAIRGIVSGGVFLLLSASFIVYAFMKIFGRESNEYVIFFTLSFLMRYGVPLSEAVTQCMYGLRNKNTERALYIIRKGISEGLPLPEAFERAGYFSGFVIGWLGIASDNGNAVEIFANLASYYRNKDNRVRNIVGKIIEPIVIIITGIYLLILIKAIILPILTYAGGMYG